MNTIDKTCDDILDVIIATAQKRRITAYRLANMSGVTNTAINNIFLGRQKNITLKTLIKLANVLGLKVSITIKANNQSK